jgi:hypothetical protein
MPALPDIYTEPKVGSRVFRFGMFMFLLFIACATFMFLYQKDYPNLSVILSAVWIVLVSVYFYMEHIFIFRPYGNPEQYDQFKRVQDLAAKIWAAAVLVLAAFYAHKFPG